MEKVNKLTESYRKASIQDGIIKDLLFGFQCLPKNCKSLMDHCLDFIILELRSTIESCIVIILLYFYSDHRLG